MIDKIFEDFRKLKTMLTEYYRNDEAKDEELIKKVRAWAKVFDRTIKDPKKKK